MDIEDNQYYLEYDDPNFNKMLNKYEFSDIPKKRFIYQQPRQLLLKNLISKNTIYDSVLLYFSTGVGKTCAAISIAEGFKEYINNMGNKIMVLVKNGNIEENFRKELKGHCVGDSSLYNIEPEEGETLEDLQNKINRKINKVYSFITYGSFVNQVIGTKVFTKDSMGVNTKTTLKDDSGKIIRKVNNQITNLNNTVIIIDEAHNVTNNDVYLALEKVLQNSYNYRLVLLTATPIFDNPKEIFEISNLLNMNHKQNLLPIRNDLFKDFNNHSPLMEKIDSGNLKGSINHITEYGKKYLEKSLLGKISYLSIDNLSDSFAKKQEKGVPLTTKIGSTNIVLCKMSQNQYNIYKKAFQLDSNSLSLDLSDEIASLESGENENENDIVGSSSLYKNSSDASTFVYPGKLFGKNGYNECFENGKLKSKYNYIFTDNLDYYSTKLFTLLQNINNSPGSSFVYSNYVNFGGIALVKQLLLSNGYKQYPSNSKKTFIMYDDSISLRQRENYRKIFNSNENKYGDIIKVIIGSPIVSEGISLYNVRQVHILEPSWNMSRINQIIGRAIRFNSHKNLEINDRTVEIYKYVSVGNDDSDSIDKQKYLLSEYKDRSNKVVERLLKRLALDCNINKKTGIGGSPECDYQDCDYTCVIPEPIKSVDKFTYNMFIQFFDKYDIEYSTELIKNLYKSYFIWSIDDIIDKIKNINKFITVESIYTSIYLLVNNKIIINDKYERDGFLIQKDNLFIFNPIDKNINTSVFAKILDFNENSNPYNLQDYIKKYKKIPEIEEPKEKIKKTIVNVDIDEITKAYNQNIIENNKIYATIRNKGVNGGWGVVDNKLRIIDIRNKKIEDDRRIIPTGMALSSKKSNEILNIIEYLNIDPIKFIKYHSADKDTILRILQEHTEIDYSNLNINELLLKVQELDIPISNIKKYLKLSKDQLINILHKYLIENKLILK